MTRAAAVALAVVACGSARADTIALSKLATKARVDHPAKLPAGIHIEAETPANLNYIQITEAACFVTDIPEQWLRGDDDLDADRRNDETTGTAESIGVERLVVHDDGEADLERMLLDGTHLPTARARIPLHRVAMLDAGHAVYAYRYGSSVFVLAASTGAVDVRFDSRGQTGGRGVTRSQRCGYGITQLRITKHASQAAQLHGTLGAQYLVDTSLTQTSRDPEPLLAVTARLLGKP